MMRLQRASVIVTVVLLTCAATAYAECAWVLWLSHDSSPWGVFQAFSTREGCIEAMSRQVAAGEKRNPRVTLDTIGGSFTTNAKGRILRGQCLPDTVDPRGPKGK
jgi:hypothetical protein